MDDLHEEWVSVWSGMTDEELEDRLFTYLWLSLHSSNMPTLRPNWFGKPNVAGARKWSSGHA
jgi:hypothetical protein